MRNINIELLRIVCFIMVISNHVLNKGYVYNGEMVDIICLWNIFNIVAVPCFFMITGYFLFDGKRYVVKVKKLIKSIVIPSAFVIILTIIFYPYIIGKKNFTECFYIDKDNFRVAWEHLRNWNTSFDGCWHLWYIFAYIKIFIWYPILRIICKEGRLENIARRWVIALCFFNLLISNLQIFGVLQSLPSVYSIIDVNVMYVILGYEFKNVPAGKFRKFQMLGLFMFIAASIVGYFGTCYFFNSAGEFKDTFYHSGSLFMALASIGFFVFMINLKLDLEPKLIKIICLTGKSTFYAYLIQYFLIFPLGNFFKIIMKSAIFQYIMTIVFSAIFTLTIAGLINRIGSYIKERD